MRVFKLKVKAPTYTEARKLAKARGLTPTGRVYSVCGGLYSFKVSA